MHIPYLRMSLIRSKPKWFFAGIATGLLGCIGAGHMVSRTDRGFNDFVRVHHFIDIETKYYATITQLFNTVNSLEPDRNKVIVVVSGNSIAWGFGQRPNAVWTQQLQALLGDNFTVVNLALRGGFMHENGGIVANMLHNAGRKVVVVANELQDRPGAMNFGQNRSVTFWDGYFKNYTSLDYNYVLLREEASLMENNSSLQKLEDDMRLGLWLDGWMRFRDLWSVIGYHAFFTIWQDEAADQRFFMAPRRLFTDPSIREAQPSFEERADRFILARPISGVISAMVKTGCLSYEAQESIDHKIVSKLTLHMPDYLRKRTIIFLLGFAPKVIDQLSEQEKKCFSTRNISAANDFRRAGYYSVLPIDSIPTEDYWDFDHLMPSGGDKLAKLIAPTIIDMADKLGYTH